MAKTNRKRVVEPMPGYGGAQLYDTDVRVTAVRGTHRSIRCRPGTFEWRYGRKTGDSALYHAGIHFADLWERAGIASAASPDLGSAGGGQWKGLPDGRAVAISEINAARVEIGRVPMSRLVDYCVMGTSASEMAAKYRMDERGMSFVLHADLQMCAAHFRYVSNRQ